MHQQLFRKFDVSTDCPFLVEVAFRRSSTPMSSDPPVSDGGNHPTVPGLIQNSRFPAIATTPSRVEIPAQMRALKCSLEFNPGGA
jgi:hypothetical protein